MNKPRPLNNPKNLTSVQSQLTIMLLLVLIVFLNIKPAFSQPCVSSTFQIVDGIPGNPSVFKWTDSCSDAKSYELQILRLYNVDPSKKTQQDITAKIDWDQAITYIVGKSKPSGVLTWDCDWLTLSEGTGFYLWRIRRVRGEGHYIFADPDKWSAWTSTGSYVDGATVSADMSAASTHPYLFYYDQFDDNINWLYKRAFLDNQNWEFRSSQLNETIDYMDYLLMPLQKQKQVHEEQYNGYRHAIVSQTVVDNSGRPSLTTLPVPGPTWLSYQQDFLKNSSGNVYKADDYDNQNTYNNPSNVTGAFADYYSDGNIDRQIPTAGERPFARTLYFNDGLSRPREITSPGTVHQPDPNHTTNKSTANTIRKFYSTPTETELIYMFGDEAPKSETVLKTYSEDPNGTWTLTYTNELDQVLASCYSKPMSNLTNNSISYIYMGVKDTITQKIEVSPTQFLSTKSYTFTEPTSLSYVYSIIPKSYGNQCLDLCGTCDYKITLTAKERDDTLTYRRFFNVPPTIDTVSWSCTGSQIGVNGTYQLPNTMLDPGTYDITLFIELSNVNPTTGRLYVDELVDKLHRKIDTSLYKTGGYTLPHTFSNPLKRVDSMLFYANNADYERLITYLNVDTSKATFDIVFNDWCDTITLPTVKCKHPDCTVPRFAEFMKDKLQDEDQNNGNQFFINAYTNTTNKGLAFTTDTANLFKIDNDQEFNDIISRMIADGYNCDQLWSAWRQTVNNYIVSQRAIIDSKYTKLEDTMIKHDWWGYFMKLVGYKVALTQRPHSELFSSTSLSRLKPYQYFAYDWGDKADLEELFCYMYTQVWPCTTSTWRTNIKNFPTFDPQQESFHMHNFYVNIKTNNYLSSYKKLNSISTIFNPTHSITAQVIAQGQQMCIEGCKSRMPQIVTDIGMNLMDEHQLIVEGFLYDTWRPAPVSTNPVNLVEVFCLSNAVIEQCKSMCDFTPDSGAYLSKAKLQTITKAMVYDARIHTKPTGFSAYCPPGYDSIPTPPVSKQMAMLAFLNMSVQHIMDSLVMSNSKTVNWSLLLGNLSLGNSTPLNSPPCNDMAVMIAGNDQKAFLHYGTDYTVNTTCGGEQVILYRKAVDSVYKGWETNVKLSVQLRVDIAANDSMVFYETIPSGFTFVSGDGPFSSGQMKYVMLGPLDSGDVIDINYTIKAPLTVGTYPFSGALLRYDSGSLIETCSLNNQSIVVASCLALRYHREVDGGEFQTSVLCTNVCDNVDSCNYEICIKWDMGDDLDLDDYPDSTIRVKSCGDLVCAGFQMALGSGMYNIHQKQEALLRQSYQDRCTNRGAIDDMWKTEHGLDMGQFTLFSYDRAGNLVRTVAPNGGDANTSATRMTKMSNGYRSEYDHDTRGKVLRQYTTDGNVSLFWYDFSGRLRASRSAFQRTSGKFTYYKYDVLDRLVESGEQNIGAGIFEQDIENMSFPATSVANTDHITQIFYDEPYPVVPGGWPFPYGGGLLPNNDYQQWLENRVSYTITDQDGDMTTTKDQVMNMYSYDPHGNVELFYQYLDGMDPRVIKYDNAIIAGKVNSYEILHYQGYGNTDDKLKVIYEYNMDGKPEFVFTADPTSTWGKKPTTMPTNPEAQIASYIFNAHDDNQLKRTEMGNKLQGLDYTYTIEGWLKAINHPNSAMDPGNDGNSPNCREDVYSQLNHYYDRDFDRPSSQFMNNANEFIEGPGLYNGVITGLQTNVKAPVAGTSNSFEGYTTGSAFEYDELYRLKQSVFNWYDPTAGPGNKWKYPNPHQLGTHFTSMQPYEYDEEFSYDKNGNFTTMKRWGATGTTPPLTPVQTDDASYGYNGATNRMNYFGDAIGNAGMDDPESTSYATDASGRVTGVYTVNPTPEMWNFTWRYDDKPVYMQSNRVTSLFPVVGIKYLYDANGNRVKKYTTSVLGMSGSYTNTAEYYQYGADGTLLATYSDVKTTTTPTDEPYIQSWNIKERYLYGVDRLGTIQGVNNGSFYNYNLRYEVHDHLGNVRASFTNIPSNAFPVAPDVMSYNNYYAFGSLQPSRHYNALSYSMGFNGQMKEEGILTGGNATTIGNTRGGLNFAKYWMYDTRIGRRWNIDPVDMISQSNYSVNGNNPICNSDPDGKKFYNFNSKGEYTGTSHDNWFHNIFFKQGRILDDKGNVTRRFRFADRENDTREIEDGTINKVVLVTDNQMRLMVGRSGGFSHENKVANRSLSERYSYILWAGQGGKPMDFSYSQIPKLFPEASKDPDNYPSSMLFLPPSVKGSVDAAHNHMNFGNFLFGLSGEAQGFWGWELGLGAHHRARTQDGEDGYDNQFDSKDDQFSISKGYEYGRSFYYDKKEFKVLPGQATPVLVTPK